MKAKLMLLTAIAALTVMAPVRFVRPTPAHPAVFAVAQACADGTCKAAPDYLCIKGNVSTQNYCDPDDYCPPPPPK